MIHLIHDPLTLYGYGIAVGAIAGMWCGILVGRYW
jgi:hypothetical protein